MSEDFTPSTLHTRPTLLFRLRDWQDSSSWEEFYRLYHRLVFNLALRSGLTRTEAEDVAQDVFKRVAETIHEFESDPSRGSFRGWLMNLTRWRVADQFRKRNRATRFSSPPGFSDDSDRTSTLDRVPDTSTPAPDAGWEDEWERHIFDAALARLAKRVDAKHFQAFDLFSRQGWPVLRVARELGINPATVYVIKHRLTKLLKVEVEALSKQLG